MNPEELAAYKEHLVKTKGFTPEEADLYLTSKGLVQEPSTLSKVGDVALRALDYTSGLGRGALGGAAQAISGEDLGVRLEDVLKGKAPSSSEMLAKAGVPEGYSLSDVLTGAYSEDGKEWLKLKKGGLLDPSARGAAGFVGDVALDPLTYLTLGAGPAVKAAAKGSGKLASAAKVADIAMNPVAKSVEGIGEKLYKSGLKGIDTRVIERGGQEVSPFMLERGMWGGEKSLQSQVNKQLQKLGQERSALYKSLPEAKVDPNIASEDAMKYLSGMEANPYMAPKVSEGLDYLALASDKPAMSLEQASKIKSELYDTLPMSMFDPQSGAISGFGKDLNKNLASGYRKEIAAAAERAKTGAGKKVDLINEEMGAYLSAQKPLRTEVAKEARKNLMTQTKLGAAFIDPLITLGAYTGQALNAVPVRTGAGLLLDRAGQNVPEAVWRQILLAPTREDK